MPLRSNFLKEACIENLDEALSALNQVDQFELCSNLAEDGLTPSLQLTKDVIAKTHLPVKVMIRSRAGNFHYTDIETQEMLDQIKQFKVLNIQGFVLGALKANDQLDYLTVSKLCEAALPYPVTIHKCFDLIPNWKAAIETLKKISNVKFILSSGSKVTAWEGKDKLKEMMQIAQTQISIIPAGKVTSANLSQLHSFLDAPIYHGRRIAEN